MSVRSRITLLFALLVGVLAPAAASASPGAVRLVRSGAWAHRSAYALDPASPEAAAHPEWILKDAAGNRLHIGSSYAADFGAPAYRSWWIAQAAAQAGGDRGLYVDDVLMERRTTNSWGLAATPRDPRTGANMSETKWQRYMADFMVELRAALPATEIVHEVLWAKGSGNANLRRELDAANFVSIERGFIDPAVVGGSGTYGFRTLAAFVEARQAAGRGVIVDGTAATPEARLYGLATYLLVDAGATALATDASWAGFGVQLGAPLAVRFSLGGAVWRRDFAQGLVLVNEPGGAMSTVAVGPGYFDLDGIERTSVTLSAGTGAVLLRAPAPTDTGVPPVPVTEAPPPSGPASATPTTGSGINTKQRPSKVTAHTAGAREPTATRTTARVAGLRVYGRVRGAVSGSVRVTVQRKRGSGWATVRRTSASVSRRGAYERPIARLPRGTYRVSARFLGTGTALPSASGYSRRSI